MKECFYFCHMTNSQHHFALPNPIRVEVEKKYGQPVRYPKDCIALSEDIFDKCRRRISESTLKRMMGFVKGIRAPRRYTLDIIAQYLDHTDYLELEISLGVQGDSEYRIPMQILAYDLDPGMLICFCYDPNRQVIVRYQGNHLFEVCESQNSSLQCGDSFKAVQFVENFPLYLSEVTRNQTSLGPFTAGKAGGIKNLRFLDHALTDPQ
jgi:hypothetical protein